MWLELVVTKEYWVRGYAYEYGLCFLIPLDSSSSIGDTKSVSKRVTFKCILNCAILSVERAVSELPDFALLLKHDTFVDNLSILEADVVFELWVPHVI